MNQPKDLLQSLDGLNAPQPDRQASDYPKKVTTKVKGRDVVQHFRRVEGFLSYSD
jgi:hypothetical protein